MQALAAEPDIYQKLAASVAPGIWQLDDIKKGLLCQLFGGTTKVQKSTPSLASPEAAAWTAAPCVLHKMIPGSS